MTLQQIQYALRVAECGSMNKAAEGLFITQPTLTKSIKELENEIGISLFLRTHKGVTPTAEGAAFLEKCRNMYRQYEKLHDEYVETGNFKRKFGVSTKKCLFAVKAFVETAKQYDMAEFEFSFRETETLKIIKDVSSLRSEIGILYVNASNRKIIKKLLVENELLYTELTKRRAYVYLQKNHPLANEETISPEQLAPYTYISFEQEERYPNYLAEEFPDKITYPRTIKTSDRATMLDIINGLNGFTLGSGIMSEELNGAGYVIIPFRTDDNSDNITEIGYITKKYSILSEMGEKYLSEIKKFINNEE